MQYPELYEIMYLGEDGKTLKSFDKTSDKDIAIATKEALIKQGYKQVIIQHTFKEGGKITDSVQLGFRSLFLETPIVYGRKIEISMPNGEKRQAQFAIVDAQNILASHNEHNFSSTVGYPTINGENINDRNYADDKNAQAKVIEVAQNLDPNILVSTSRTPSGTPIITKDGIVVSGNNRTMSIKRAITDFPDQYKKYVDFLKEESFAFAIDGLGSIKHPILVRIDYDFPEYNTTELSKYNKETKKSERPIDKAIKIGKMLNENEGCKNMIAELVGEYETFSQFYASYSDQVKLRDMLISCNIITKNELAAYFDERGFTEAGKDLIENLLAGMILNKDALVAGSMAGGRQFKNIVITSLPVLAKNASLGENSLIDLLNKAFLLEKKIHDSGLDFKDYIVQGNMFDEAPEKNVLIMNRLLAEGRNKFKGSIDAYNQSAIDNQNESLFGDKPSFQEMYDTYITNKIQPEILKMINDTSSTQIIEPNTPESFDEAIMAQIQAHDEWKGNVIKERHVLSEISNLIKGDEPEKEKEVKRIFALYADKFPGELSQLTKQFLFGFQKLGSEIDYNSMSLDDLIALKKKKYSNMDIESPKSDDEKQLEQAIAQKFSVIQTEIREKRKLEQDQKQAEILSNIEGSDLYKSLKKDFMFILSLQKSKNETGSTEGWDINLFKSSFTNKIHKNAWGTSAPIVKKILSDLKKIQEEQLTKPAFTKNHQIWQYLDDKSDVVETKENTNDIMQISITETEMNEMARRGQEKMKVDLPQIQLPNTLNLLVNDNWFAAHPDKVLGEPYKASGRFGEVTKYKGKIDSVDRIDAPLNFMQINEAENPTISTQNETVNQLLQDPQAQQNIEIALEGTRKETVIREVKKHTKAITRIVANNPVLDADMVSFERVFAENNPEISKDELQAFVWYKETIGERLSSKWYQLSGWQMGASPLIDWINNGILFHYRGSLLPAYLYLSGNIWEKKTALENDKENIVSLYGTQVYENQKLALDNVFKISYDKRLTLTNANFDNRLKLLPISKFANTFMIDTLVDGKEFKMKSQPAGGKQPGRPDFLYVGHMSDWKKTKFAQLSLTEAFQYWLVEYRGEYQLKKDTNYAEIIKIYIQQGQRPSLGKDATAADKKEAEAIWQRKLNITKEEGDRLFSIFLAEWLNVEDIVKIETTWNERFNGYMPVNYNKIPIAFSHAKEYRNSIVDIRPEKREAIAFLMNEGSGCLAYDVGVGKTWSALFAIKQFMDAGYCKRPFIVVPNQVYKQFLAEGKGLFPDVKFNDLYNLSKDYISELKDSHGNIEKVEEYSISVLTYEGFEQIGFNEITANQILSEMYDILDQNPDQPARVDSKSGQKKEASFYERLQMLIGRGLRGTLINIEDLGFDFACYDEAHKMKKLFVGVKGEMKAGGEDREKNPYQIQAGGAPSSIALKGFMISQYILKNNNNRNVLTLTATPFTNSPLEIFSVLTFIAYSKLKESSLNNLKSFFDTYVHATNELVINAKLRPERKQVVLGFNNLQSLQQLISRFVLYKTGEMISDLRRPSKYILPYKSKLIGNAVIKLSESERVDTTLPLSAQQSALMAEIKAYAEGKLELSAICGTVGSSDKKTAENADEEDMVDATAGVELDESSLNDDEKAGVRTLRAMSYARNLALSPYLYECAGLGKPTYLEYIETSPKLNYVMECVRSVKEYHEKAKTPISGQVIYMDRGIEYFGLIKEYLIKEIGFKEHEIGIIKSQMPGGKDAKEKVKMAFLGEAYDEKTGELYDIPDDQRMKIVIGSSTIKEGINLQKHSTVLYNCFVDWNPTDIKQLEGRIWRQGNLYNSVRIATPLMEDSMDIFIFQKLSEKTARIAEIWDSNGESNTFNLQEFNPSEIKSALISDPMVLAELQLIEDKEKIDDDIRGLKNEQSMIDKIIDAKETFDAYFDDFDKWVDQYRPKKEGETRSFSTLLGLANGVVKTQLDSEGRKMEYSYNRTNKHGVVYSDKSPASKPYYQDKLVLANRTLQKAEKEYLKPKGLTIEKLPLFKESLNDRIKELEESKTKVTSEESIKLRADYIAAERAANKVESVGVAGRVKEFKRLNYLLDDKVKKSKKVEAVAMSCPPVDEKGNRRIDKEAIEHLTICVNNLPKTKELHTDKDGNYTAERKKLHEKIVASFKQNATCIKRDRPVAILTGGAPGSGKTHFLKNYAPYLLSKNIFHIDADEVREKLPEYKGWNAGATHHETKDIVDELIDDIGGKCKFDTIYDGTMNKAKKYYELIDKLKSVGYDVYIIYIDVPQEVSEKRVLERYQRTGRFVPMDVVQEVFDAGHTAFDQIKKMVNGWILVDGMSGQVMETGGEKIPQDRDYAKLTDTVNFKKEQEITDANRSRKIKVAKAKAEAQKQRIRILALNKKDDKKSDIQESDLDKTIKAKFKHLSNQKLIDRANAAPDFKWDDEAHEIERRMKVSEGKFKVEMHGNKLVIIKDEK